MEKKEARDFLIAIGASYILYITIGTFLFTFPLLLLDRRYQKRTTDTACVAALVLVVADALVRNRLVLGQDLTWAFIMVNLFIPVSLILCAIVWVNADRRSLFERVVLSCAPILVLFLIFEIIFVLLPEVANSVKESYLIFFDALFGSLLEELNLGISDVFFEVLLLVMLTLSPVLLVINEVLIAYLYEATSHPRNEEFEFRVATFTVPDWVVYPFLALWTMVILFAFIQVSPFISVPVLALSLVVSLIYLLQGFAIIYFNIRSRGSMMSSMKLCILLTLLILFIPGINAILVLTLSVIGVLENWINLRKRKEFSNEDYS